MYQTVYLEPKDLVAMRTHRIPLTVGGETVYFQLALPRNGLRHGRGRLSHKQRARLKDLYHRGGISQKSLARKYKLSLSTVQRTVGGVKK